MLGDSLYLDNIEEYVQDESKIVTYKWLSRCLEVPANTAKRMLYSYVRRCQESHQQLSVTYLVTGLSNNQGHQVCIVEEEDLEDTKKKFAALLGVHIYSVQKYKLKESCSLYTADYDIGEEHTSDYSRWSPIECSVNLKNVVAKKEKSISQSDSTAKPPLPVLSHMERNNDSKQDIAPSQVVKQEKPKQTTKVSTSSKPKPKPPAKGSMMSFFVIDSGDKQKAPPPAKKVEAKPQQPQQQKPQQKETSPEPVSSTLKPLATPPKTEAPSSRIKTAKSKASGLFDGLNDSDIDDDEASGEEKPQPKQAKPKQATKPLRQRGKKNSRTTQGAKQDKNDPQQKRRRVQELSSDEEATESGVRSVPASKVKTGPGGKRRKKVRRLVPKMYTTDDGEMVTERSWEMVSTDVSSEEDSALTVSKKAKIEPKKEGVKVSPKKTKQATLMKFFTK